MVDETATELDEEIEVEAKPRNGLTGKKVVLMVGLPVLLLIFAAVGAYFSGLADPLLGGEEDGEAEPAMVADSGPGHFYRLPELLVNLDTGRRSATFLKVALSLETETASDMERLRQIEPRIIDAFHVYLRELTMDDLKGSAGLQRLREELLVRLNAMAHPIRVKDVLFKEILIQ